MFENIDNFSRWFRQFLEFVDEIRVIIMSLVVLDSY